MSVFPTVLAVALAIAWSLPQETTSEAVPFELHEDGSVIVPVVVDGIGPVPFLVDTGATGSVLFEGLARRLALPAVARRLVITSVGREMRAVVRVGRVAVGGAQAVGLLASVVPHSGRDQTGVAIQGILAQDFLSGFNYTLDYRRRRLYWGAVETTDGDATQVRLPLRPSEGRFLVGLPQAERGTLWFVPDTGANGVVVYEGAGGRELPTDPLPGRYYEVIDLAGRRVVEARRIPRLQVGGFILRNLATAVIRRPETDAPEGGLLPLHLFASVTFASREGYILIRRR